MEGNAALGERPRASALTNRATPNGANLILRLFDDGMQNISSAPQVGRLARAPRRDHRQQRGSACRRGWEAILRKFLWDDLRGGTNSRAPEFSESYGGEGGIRTLGRALRPYDGLANRCFRPLSHLSVFNSPDFSGFWSMPLHYTAIFAFRGTIATVLSLLFRRCTARRFASSLE